MDISKFEHYLIKLSLFGGGVFLSLFGEFNELFTILIVLMVVDYGVGTLMAAFGYSSKTENGRITSKQIWLGIAKKVGVLVIIMLAKLVGDVMEFQKLRDMVIFGYITFEATSLLEHASFLGIPLPKVIKDMLEIMQTKEQEGLDHEL